MEKVAMSLLLFSALMIIAPMIHGQEDPKEIEQWFRKVRHHREKVTRLHFYFHDIPKGENVTSAEVAQANMTDSSPTYFGYTTMMDYPATVEPDITSKLVARAQGFYASDSMHEKAFIVSMNIIFPEGEYNGSSIAVFGHDPIRRPYSEMPIVGGSGAFRLARGLVIFRTYFQNHTTGQAILGVDVVVMHH